MELVSVLMCVYNEPINWIEISLQSIITQSYQKIEVIIVVDSPDRVDLIELLNKYSILDDRIIVVINPKNLGLTKSLNNGLLFCKGKYVARMDADDISVANRIEKQLNFLQENKQIILCGSNIIEFNEFIDLKRIDYPSEHNLIINKLILEPSFAHPTIMFDREQVELKLKKKDFYDVNFIVAQDYKLYVDLLGSMNFGNVPEYLLFYRRSENQITANKKIDQINNSKRCRKITYDYVKKSGSSYNYSNAYVLEWLSRKEYNLNTLFLFIVSGAWRFFNLEQLFAFLKRFIRGPQSLVD